MLKASSFWAIEGTKSTYAAPPFPLILLEPQVQDAKAETGIFSQYMKPPPPPRGDAFALLPLNRSYHL